MNEICYQAYYVTQYVTQAYSIGLRNAGRFAMTHHVLCALSAITHYIYVDGRVILTFGHAMTQYHYVKQ